jgi:hypothetical protein
MTNLTLDASRQQAAKKRRIASTAFWINFQGMPVQAPYLLRRYASILRSTVCRMPPLR